MSRPDKKKTAFDAVRMLNEKVLEAVGIERSHWFGLITYVNVLRKEAKKLVKDEKDSESVNNKIMELLERDLNTKGKTKVADMIKKFTEDVRAKKSKKN